MNAVSEFERAGWLGMVVVRWSCWRPERATERTAVDARRLRLPGAAAPAGADRAARSEAVEPATPREHPADFGAGDYLNLPAQMQHAGSTKNGVVVQVSSTGPFEVNYVDPKDDPRKQAPAAAK